MIRDLDPIEPCSECKGFGDVVVSEPEFWDYMKGWSQRHPPYEGKICLMLKMYHKWEKTSFVPCRECQEEL